MARAEGVRAEVRVAVTAEAVMVAARLPVPLEARVERVAVERAVVMEVAKVARMAVAR